MTPAEEAEFESFYHAAAQRVVGWVFAVTGNRAAAEDACQEAFVRAFRKWDQVAAMDRADLWVRQVAVRIAIDQWRKTKAQNDLSDTLAVPHDDAVTRLWVQWGMTQLSPQQRAAFLAQHVGGYTVSDIAGDQGLSRETTKTHLARARARLRQLLHVTDEN